jgi:hypothetical protein
MVTVDRAKRWMASKRTLAAKGPFKDAAAKGSKYPRQPYISAQKRSQNLTDV